ncbi:hypothetical protein EON65_37275 [archaeon]|nr:MAG: hypothetical protein EON65_37275 [archaeon]
MLFTLKHHQGPVAALCEHPFSNWICSAGKDGACKIWNLTNGQLLLDIPALVDGVLNPHAKLNWEAKVCSYGQPLCWYINIYVLPFNALPFY